MAQARGIAGLRMGSPGTITAPTRERIDAPDDVITPDKPWTVIVWNDPVNLMAYVTFVFQKTFGYPREKAHKLMMEVHVEGRSAVWNGQREQAEAYVAALHTYGLWATMERND